ncbi:MAG: methyl-accepting chemotaxis protein [Motiliproteus sp.]|nr:methyl-accepting chemotaxis protein [Motiliproteus sp.]
MSELVQSFRLVAGHAVEASGTAELGQQSVQHSAEVMDSLTGSIGDLAREASEGAGMVARLRDDSQNIESVLNVIISIADQTNLLALNAAIEAARAGDHGRGFAVVADEVRQLAQRTAESTQEIRQMIEGLQQSSDHVVTAMERQQRQAERSVEYASKAGESLHQVVDAISQISGMNTLIAQATEEQSCSADSVQESVADVQCQSQTAAQQATDVRRQSDDLSQVSLGLTRLVERYVI